MSEQPQPTPTQEQPIPPFEVLTPPEQPVAKPPQQLPVLICLISDCPSPVKSRGLCGTCYATAKKLVNRGVTTWAWLEQQKPPLAKPLYPRKPPKPAGPFAAKFEAAAALVPQLPMPPQPVQAPQLPAQQVQPVYSADQVTQDAIAAGQQSVLPAWPNGVPLVPGPEAAHAAADGPPPPIAVTATPPVPGLHQQAPDGVRGARAQQAVVMQPPPMLAPQQAPVPPTGLVPVDPTTGQPYAPPPLLAQPVPIPAQQPPAPMPTQAAAPAAPLPWEQ